MSRIRLIVNADDFGFTHDVNEGIVEAHHNGILTATTLMANGDAFEHAVRLAKANPTLDVGCHLVLVQGTSLLEPGRELPATLEQLTFAVLARRMPIYEEMSAQVRKLLGAGVAITHLDTHKHTHLLPPVLNAMARVAREFRILWVRRRFPIPTRLEGVRTTDHFTGFRLTGALNEQRLVRTLESMPAGLTELMCHPGRVGDELRRAATRLKESRAIELRALTSPAVREAVGRRNIELTNYRGG